MMKRQIDRRTLLVATGVAGIAAVSDSATAQSTDISGAIEFEDNTVIPEGHVRIYLEDLTIQGSQKRRIVETRVNSDGASKTIAFSLPAGPTNSPRQRIVARLERTDGWLLARGSAKFEAGSPIHITLTTVMY